MNGESFQIVLLELHGESVAKECRGPDVKFFKTITSLKSFLTRTWIRFSERNQLQVVYNR